jgi:hypothetical protein
MTSILKKRGKQEKEFTKKIITKYLTKNIIKYTIEKKEFKKMKDVKNYILKNICIFCPNNINNNCMKIQTNNKNGVLTYKCLNFQRKEKPKRIYDKFIKFEYLNEFNKFIAVIIKETPQHIIDELKYKYDGIEIMK